MLLFLEFSGQKKYSTEHFKKRTNNGQITFFKKFTGNRGSHKGAKPMLTDYDDFYSFSGRLGEVEIIQHGL